MRVAIDALRLARRAAKNSEQADATTDGEGAPGDGHSVRYLPRREAVASKDGYMPFVLAKTH